MWPLRWHPENLRCPDWVLVRREIAHSDTWSAVQRKRREYLENRVIQVWVDPEERQEEVISPTHGARTYSEGETVMVEELPGLELNLFRRPPNKVGG